MASRRSPVHAQVQGMYGNNYPMTPDTAWFSFGTVI